MTLVLLCAWTFGSLTAGTILFQLALALGAPWGELTLGGRHRGVLPGVWRLVPLGSAIILVAFLVVVLARAGVAFTAWSEPSRGLIWVVVGYSALGCLANAATPSPRERRIWLPVVILMLATSLAIALS